MTRIQVSTFEQELERHTASWSRTTAAEFDAVLAEQLDQPAVGTPLPFDGVSLDDHPVTISPSPAQLAEAKTSVTPVEFAIADYGSIVITSGHEGTEQVSLYPNRHVAVLRASDILPDMASAFDRLGDAFAEGLTSAVIATGPSATADMGELVYGVHGPSNVHVLILTDR